MLGSEEKQIRTNLMFVKIVWRNPLTLVQAQLRDEGAKSLLRMGGASQKHLCTPWLLGRDRYGQMND